jgi:hypothetical protein
VRRKNGASVTITGSRKSPVRIEKYFTVSLMESFAVLIPCAGTSRYVREKSLSPYLKW